LPEVKKMNTEQVNQLLQLLVQIVIVVVPILLSWFARNYVKSSADQKKLGLITSVAQLAVDYAEDLGQRKEVDDALQKLGLPPDQIANLSSGLKKLNVASHWMSDQLAQVGIKATPEEAKAWVASEFQRQMGGVAAAQPAAETVKQVTGLIDQLDKQGLIQMPAGAAEMTQFVNFLANWVVTQLGALDPDKKALQHEQAVVLLNAKLAEKAAGGPTETHSVQPVHPVQPTLYVQPVQPVWPAVDTHPIGDEPTVTVKPVAVTPPTDGSLAGFVQGALTYVADLKASNAGIKVSDRDIAVAWILVHAAEQGCNFASQDIAAAVTNALAKRSNPPIEPIEEARQ
jgi:hypothetical protein